MFVTSASITIKRGWYIVVIVAITVMVDVCLPAEKENNNRSNKNDSGRSYEADDRPRNQLNDGNEDTDDHKKRHLIRRSIHIKEATFLRLYILVHSSTNFYRNFSKTAVHAEPPQHFAQ